MTTKTSEGKITQIIGPVVDFKFQRGHLPSIGNAINVKDNDRTVVFETMQHLGDESVRTVSMTSTDGLVEAWLARIQAPQLQFLLEKKPWVEL